MDVLFPLAVFGLIGTVILSIVARRFGEEESRWLVPVVLAAFAVRIGTATMFALIPSTRFCHEDAEGYEHLGMAIAAGWRGEGPPIQIVTDLGQNRGYFFVCGAIYYVFGRCRPAASYVNCLLGGFTVLLVYRLARQFFHVAVARRAALLTAFIPSMILWSAVALKDPVMSFLIVLALTSCVSLKRRFSVPALLGTVLPVVAMQPIRFYMVYFLVVAIFASLLFERGARALAGVSKQILLGVALVGFLAFVGFAGRAQEGIETFDFKRLSEFRQGMASTADSGFAGDTDVSTPGRALAFMPVGMTYLLFSPFPWQMTSLRASFAAPEMLVWWLLIPSLIRGIRFTVRERFGPCSPILLFALLLTSAYSLMHGNVGSGFRQRAQIFVLLFIFASLGSYMRACRKRGIDERRLLMPLPDAPPPVAPPAVAMAGS